MSLIDTCHELIQAYKLWLLGNMKMPEDAHPDFSTKEEKLAYFTLPMALNYQRNSYTLRESAYNTFLDTNIKRVFDINRGSKASTRQLQDSLLKYKVALQPNKHTQTRSTISQTINQNWWSIENLLIECDHDFLKLQDIVQVKYKKWFPYLSGPKIFHYRSYILWEYCDVGLKNKEYIEIAPDTHVIQCSVRLWVITEEESKSLTRDQISLKWRSILSWSGLTPIDMHSPLWFWSRNGFSYTLLSVSNGIYKQY